MAAGAVFAVGGEGDKDVVEDVVDQQAFFVHGAHVPLADRGLEVPSDREVVGREKEVIWSVVGKAGIQAFAPVGQVAPGSVEKTGLDGDGTAYHLMGEWGWTVSADGNRVDCVFPKLLGEPNHNNDRRMKHRIKSRLPFLRERCRDKRVLDVGCIEHTLEKTTHPDWLHAHLKSTAKELVGIDCEAEIAEELNRHGYNVIVANAVDFDIRDKYPEGFDVIVAGEIIEHLTNPGLFMECLAKHLAPGGEIIVTTPNAYSFLSFLETLILGHEQINDVHTLVFSRKMLHEFMKNSGFEVKEWYFTNYIYKYHESRFMRFLVWPMAFVQALGSLVRKEFCRTLVYVVQPKRIEL